MRCLGVCSQDARRRGRRGGRGSRSSQDARRGGRGSRSSQDVRRRGYRRGYLRGDLRGYRRGYLRGVRGGDRRVALAAGVGGVGPPDAVVGVALVAGVEVRSQLPRRVLVVGLPDTTRAVSYTHLT